MARRASLSYEQQRDIWARWKRGECTADIARALRFRETLSSMSSYRQAGLLRRSAGDPPVICPSRSAR
jgi:hypothetical protein